MSRLVWFSILGIGFFASPAAAQQVEPKAAAATPAEKIIKGLERWSAEQKAAAAVFEFLEPRPGAKPLDLALAIARSFGRPEVVVGDLDGAQDQLKLKIAFQYPTGAQKRTFSALTRSLLGFAGNDPPLCLAGPRGIVSRIGLSPGADERILDLLKVPPSSVEPIEQLKIGRAHV